MDTGPTESPYTVDPDDDPVAEIDPNAEPKQQWFDDVCKVWVGNLPRTARKHDLENFMRQVGIVEQACILTDDGTDLGRSRGSGWVIYSSHVSAAAAIEKLNSTYFFGRKIQVDRWWKNGDPDAPQDVNPNLSKAYPRFTIAKKDGPEVDTAKGGGMFKLNTKLDNIMRTPAAPAVAAQSIFLVCVRMPVSIRARLQCLQDAILERLPHAKQTVVPLVKSHFPLLMTRVDSGKVAATCAAFDAAGSMWKTAESKARHRFNVMGLAHLPESGSLVANVLPVEPLQRLQTTVVKSFANEGFEPLGSVPDIAVTLFKALARGGKAAKDAVESVEDLLTPARGTVDFGDSPLASMQLVDLRAAPSADGYYGVKSEVDLDVEAAVDAEMTASGAASAGAIAADDVTGGLFWASLRWVLRDVCQSNPTIQEGTKNGNAATDKMVSSNVTIEKGQCNGFDPIDPKSIEFQAASDVTTSEACGKADSAKDKDEGKVEVDIFFDEGDDDALGDDSLAGIANRDGFTVSL